VRETPGPRLSRYSMNSTIAALPHLLDMNGADGNSDIEGRATRVGASERGQRASFNEADGISDIEGKAPLDWRRVNGAAGTRAT
jgi:hypothetical protein